MEKITGLGGWKGILASAVAVGALLALGYLTSSEEIPSSKPKKSIRRTSNKTLEDEPPLSPPYAPPEGFRWYMNEMLRSMCPMPMYWHVREDPLSFAISEDENIENQPLRKGLSVSCITRAGSEKLRQWMEKYPDTLRAEGKRILGPWQKIQMDNTFSSYSFTFEDPDSEMEANTVFNLLWFNETTGTIYHILFEYPKDEYMEVFSSVARTMLSGLTFNPQL